MRNRRHNAESQSDLDRMSTRRSLTFSQAEGLEELPQPLSLGEVPPEARNLIWDAFWSTTMEHLNGNWVRNPWCDVLRDTHVRFFSQPADEFSHHSENIRGIYKSLFLSNEPYNRLFDLLQHLMRQNDCPHEFIARIRATFIESRLAYTLDTNGPPTMLPTATPEEGEALQNALARLSKAGFSGAREHLRKAAVSINRGDWPGSVRESIHAVESVARRIDPSASTLGPAINRMEREYGMHPALASACKKLYGYTSNEQGIRHAALDDDSKVGQEEAVFLFGACASFASYLAQKGNTP